MVVVAVTNYTSQNLAKCFFNLTGQIPTVEVIFLQSVTPELESAHQKDQLWSNCRLSELIKVLLKGKQEELEDHERKLIEEYVYWRIQHSGKGFWDYFLWLELSLITLQG